MSVSSLFGKLKGFWTRMDSGKRKRLVVVAVLLIAVLSLTTAVVNRTQYSVLYAGLSTAEAGEIYQKLTDMGVSVRLQGESTLLVDARREEECRMLLAAEGYPRSGFSYDLYMNNSTMGTTESERDKILVFQLQDRLQKTIETLAGVKSAIVTLSIPDNDIFMLPDERPDVTASVVLHLTYGTLPADKVEAIRNLVAGSVTGLSPQNVSVVDSNMNLIGGGNENAFSMTSERYALKKNLEKDFEARILSMLEPLFGDGQVMAAVSVSLNFDAQSTESVLYDGGAPVTVEEIRDKRPAGDDARSGSSSLQTSTTYQVNQTIRRLEQAQGSIQDIKASVIVNRESLDAGAIEQIRDIAAYAVGAGGESVNVAALPFVEISDPETVPAAAGEAPQWLTEKLILGAAGLLLAFVLVLVGIMTFRKKPVDTARAEQQADAAPREESPENMDELSYRREIEIFVDKRPDEVARLLRKWIAE
jgi:flagellar M-ring protein FliF